MHLVVRLCRKSRTSRLALLSLAPGAQPVPHWHRRQPRLNLAHAFITTQCSPRNSQRIGVPVEESGIGCKSQPDAPFAQHLLFSNAKVQPARAVRIGEEIYRPAQQRVQRGYRSRDLLLSHTIGLIGKNWMVHRMRADCNQRMVVQRRYLVESQVPALIEADAVLRSQIIQQVSDLLQLQRFHQRRDAIACNLLCRDAKLHCGGLADHVIADLGAQGTQVLEPVVAATAQDTGRDEQDRRHVHCLQHRQRLVREAALPVVERHQTAIVETPSPMEELTYLPGFHEAIPAPDRFQRASEKRVRRHAVKRHHEIG